MDDPLDWSLLRSFLAVAEEGSLTAAARRLGTSQPTLGRHIRALEARMGAALFRRDVRGLVPTETGAALIGPARAMRDAAAAAALAAAGRAPTLTGTVRLTASVAMAVFHLPPILAQLRQAEPGIAIELVASDSTANLLYREADIAIRMFRPTQLDLVTRHLGDMTLSIFAARSYAARRGLPAHPAELLEHDLIGYDRSPLIEEGFRAAGYPVTREAFCLRTDDNIAYWEMVRAGCGIGFGQRIRGRADPGLIEIDLGLTLPRLPVWLTAHDAMRGARRIRRVWDHLAAGLAPLMG